MTEHTPPTVAEIAALTARLRALSPAGVAADPAERAHFLADKDALIARITATSRQGDPPRDRPDAWIAGRDRFAETASRSGNEWADYRTFTREEAVAELVARCVPPYHAPGVVERYLDALSWTRGWSPQDQWEIDDDDLAVILDPPGAGAEPIHHNDHGDDRGLTGAEGPPIDAGPALTAEEAAHKLAADGRSLDDARALVRDYLDDVSERVGTSVHRWGLDEADLNDIRAAADQPLPDRDAADKQERRDQLNRWHAADNDEAHDLDQADGQDCPT